MVRENQKKVLKKRAFNFLVNPLSFVLCGLLIAALVWNYSQSETTLLKYQDQQGTTHTLNLSVRDRTRLTGLMQKLFAQGSFAYPLLGTKPLSWETYQNPFPLSSWTNFYDAFSEHSRTLRYGWQTWEKYQHLFPSAPLWIESPECYPGAISIFIVNQDYFNNVVKQNKEEFETVLGREIKDGSQLLEEAKNHSLTSEVLQGHQGLIGTVLGYGRNNSWKFLEGCENRMAIGCVWGEEEESVFAEEVTSSDIPLTEYYLSLYSCPSFAGDADSEESLALKKEYILTRLRVLDYYKEKDFLEATLSLLAGYRLPNHSKE